MCLLLEIRDLKINKNGGKWGIKSTWIGRCFYEEEIFKLKFIVYI